MRRSRPPSTHPGFMEDASGGAHTQAARRLQREQRRPKQGIVLLLPEHERGGCLSPDHEPERGIPATRRQFFHGLRFGLTQRIYIGVFRLAPLIARLLFTGICSIYEQQQMDLFGYFFNIFVASKWRWVQGDCLVILTDNAMWVTIASNHFGDGIIGRSQAEFEVEEVCAMDDKEWPLPSSLEHCVKWLKMDYLDHWAALETNHSATSSVTTLALKGSILCIPATTNASMVLFIMAPGGKCLIIYMQGQGVKLPDLCVREESQEKPQPRGHLETEDGGMTLHHCVRSGVGVCVFCTTPIQKCHKYDLNIIPAFC